MAYDETVANRVRQALGKRSDFEEKRMFGGLTFMVRGYMCCGVVGSELMVRVGHEGYAEALAAPHAREMDFTGRPLKGMVYVGSDGFKSEKPLDGWVARGLAFAESQPVRAASKRAPRTRSKR